MDDKIIATFCLCDDLLKALHHHEDRQCQMNDAEIMTTAFIASLCFRGNHESALGCLKMASRARFSCPEFGPRSRPTPQYLGQLIGFSA
jgi:hypothetical protein